MPKKQRVLFLCTGNSARSQIAEVLLRFYADKQFDVYSAGTDLRLVPSEVYQVLAPFGVKPGSLKPKHINEFAEMHFDYVISLCDKAMSECRAYPGKVLSLEWSFEDPYSRLGLYPFEATLSDIQKRIKNFISLETQAELPTLNFSPQEFYKQLTDDIRLRSLMLIQYAGELCVCELMAALDDIQPKISRNLALLRKSGLLLDRRQGQWIFYRTNPDLPAWIKTVLNETTENNLAYIRSAITRLGDMKERPQRAALCC